MPEPNLSLADNASFTPPPLDLCQRLLDQEITMMPEVAMHALRMANSPECDVEQFATLVSCDVKLAADILMLANSAAFGGSSRISSIHQAVVRIGLRDCRHMIVASSYKSLMSKCTLTAKWIRNALWRHSLFSGMICRHLDQELQLQYDGEAFTAALMHDVGRLLMSSLDPQHFLEVDPLEFDEETTDPVVRERAAWGTDHCEFGSWFLQHNDLPLPVVDVARHHHVVDSDTDAAELIALVRLADHAANYFQGRDTMEGYELCERDVAWWEQHLGPDFYARLAPKMQGILQRALNDVLEMVRGDSL